MVFTTGQRKEHAQIQEWLYQHYPHASKYSRAMATHMLMGYKIVADGKRLGVSLAKEMAEAYVKEHRSFG